MQVIVNKQSLTDLSFYKCQLLAKKQLLSNLKNLETLKLEEVKGMDDKMIINFSNGCQKIKKLRITIDRHTTIPIISQRSVNQLGRLKNLEEISIELNNPRISTSIFRQFYNLKNFSTWSHRIQDRHVRVILENSPNLEIMNLYRAKNITDESLRYAESIAYRREQRDRKLRIEIPDSVMEKFNLSDETFPSIYLLSYFESNRFRW